MESAEDGDELSNGGGKKGAIGGGGGGLRRGDKILSVEGQPTEGRSYADILGQGMV